MTGTRTVFWMLTDILQENVLLQSEEVDLQAMRSLEGQCNRNVLK